MMLSVGDAAGMREADRYTIEDLGVPGIVLMENAATGLVEALQQGFPQAESILVLCGSGNNGGDGLAAARHLLIRGHEVRVLLFSDPAGLRGDAAANYGIARNFGVPMTMILEEDLQELQAALDSGGFDLIIDALMGTGLSRPLDGRYGEIAGLVNASGISCIAADVPSGLQASSSKIPGPVLHAEMTVTFGALKNCLLLPPASGLCGEIVLVDIGIPPSALEKSAELWLVEEEDVTLMLPRRPSEGHKGVFGHLLILAGSPGRAGAAIMAAQAAVVGGSGLVTVALPDSILDLVDAASPESMSFGLPSTEDGHVSGQGDLQSLLKNMKALVAGPGLGTGEGAERLLREVLASFEGPVLLDADAINIFAGVPGKLSEFSGPLLLSPHPGELARLLGRSPEEVVEDRLGAAREAAEKTNALIIAKSHRTIIADPSGQAWIIPTGDHHLGTGGSGDVLTGLVGAFLAQGCDSLRAAILGCWLHGRGGELGGEDYPAALPASRLPAYIAKAWKELED